MSEPDRKSATTSPEELKANLAALVDALVDKDEEAYEAEFVHLLDRVVALVERKRCMEGTKSDTRDLLGELLFTRLRRGMQQLLRKQDKVQAQRAAEWVAGLMLSVTTLTEFAKAFDQALIRHGSGNSDFNFAGRTDFLAVEEVMQMLASGKHHGCLSLEKGDNRLDVYIRDGRIFFLDPHHIVRRVMPGDSMRHREIAEDRITKAEANRARTGRPTLLALLDDSVFAAAEMRDVLRLFGRETMFDFMRSSEPYAFYYRKLDELPQFAIEHDVRLGVTSLLLESSKQLDDWRQMLEVFPDPDLPIEPKADMFARMGETALSVIELKLLTAINGDTTPRMLVSMLGLPLYDVYALLIKLSRAGVISAPGGETSLQSMSLGVEESMQAAFAALDANDDAHERRSAIDRVFGGDDAGVDSTGGSAARVLDAVLGGDAKAGGKSEKAETEGILAFLRKKD